MCLLGHEIETELLPSRVTKLERVHFIWVIRDQHASEWFTELLARVEPSDVDHMLDIHIYMADGRELLDDAAV